MKTNPTKCVAEIISVLSYISDVEGTHKLYHCWKVAILAKNISGTQLDKVELQNMFYAGLLHDIGGISLPFHIIHYLLRQEKVYRNIVLSHPIVGASLTAQIPQMSQPSKYILDHHEQIDGKGYPRSKTRELIPLPAQILRIADAIDILLQSRQYSKLPHLITRLKINSGKEFDAGLLNKAITALKQNRLFDRINDEDNIVGLFKHTLSETGLIHISRKQDAIGKTLETAAEIIDMKHPYTAGHSLRVSRYSMKVALGLKLSHDEITRIKWAGLIHDIGKVNLERRILDKPDSLSEKEYHRVQEHANLTNEIMNLITELKFLAPIASSHHEFFDGSGYPYGLKKDHIPLASRVISICDSFDAMISNRPYRKNFTPKVACAE
ncbi:MAG: HD domain-containing protein, partial [Candidatus Omnitrophica bacterium]|nr:HD domain-containing protein [Candidatus Omnitrophota bacterium]